jgi:hypothetical protein
MPCIWSSKLSFSGLDQGESREPKKDMVYVDAEGHQRHVRDADAKLQEREKRGVHVGKTMRCIAGTHSGLLCEVLAVEPKVSFCLLSCGTMLLCDMLHFADEDVQDAMVHAFMVALMCCRAVRQAYRFLRWLVLRCYAWCPTLQ